MVELGYHLSSEEHGPADLVRYARMAEETGFTFALISDHFHPWLDKQGHSPFVWTVIGGIAQATTRLRLGTDVTCPIMRIHPAIVAQAAATAAAMLPARFLLGVGSGENLNEHIVSERWPSAPERLDMLEEAVDLMRALLQGGMHNFDGVYFTVDHARIYTLPNEPPPILLAAAGPVAARLAGRIGDGLIGTSPDKEVVETFESSGGSGKPRYGKVTVCWAPDEAQARRIAFEQWPSGSVKGELKNELALPRHFEQAVQMVREEDVAKDVVCGPDLERHVAAIRAFVDAGFDHVYIHQVGLDQEGFFRFYEREVLPRFR